MPKLGRPFKPLDIQMAVNLRTCGNTYPEIALKMGVNKDTVRRAVNRAINQFNLPGGTIAATNIKRD